MISPDGRFIYLCLKNAASIAVIEQLPGREEVITTSETVGAVPSGKSSDSRSPNQTTFRAGEACKLQTHATLSRSRFARSSSSDSWRFHTCCVLRI